MTMLSSLLITFASLASAFPGMGSPDFHSSLLSRDFSGPSNALIGDLPNLRPNQFSRAGSSIAQILTGKAPGQLPFTPAYNPAPLGTQACKQDTCCIWHHIALDMRQRFLGSSGRCNDLARQSIRLGFHDAAGWSLATGPRGGADGSIVLAPEEITRLANRGLEEGVAQMKRWYRQYGPGAYGFAGVSMADLVQFGAITATVVCPLGPRVRFFSGRRDSSVPAPDGLLPSPFETADVLVSRFRNMTIEPAGLIALIGAHTTSQQRFVDPSRAGDPQDSTPGVFDTRYYGETLGNAPPRVFKFQSDVNLANAFRRQWQSFAGRGGQAPWGEAYSREYVRLSLLGVFNINSLTECTKALPQATTFYNPPDKDSSDRWMSSNRHSDQAAQTMMNGDPLELSTVEDTLTDSLDGLLDGFLGTR